MFGKGKRDENKILGIDTLPKLKSSPKRPDLKLALITSLCFCVITALTLNDYGVTWDEAIYFYAGDSYFRWWLDPSFETIEAYWRVNHEHPPLIKLLSGLSHYIFQDKLNFFNHIFAYRLPALIFVFIANYFLFRFMADLSSLPIAFFTTLIFFFLPRLFFHAHLGAFDYPVSALGVAVIYLFWKAVKDPQNIKWILFSAIFLGLALLTKINALFIYVPLLFIWIWSYLEKRNSSDHRRNILNLIFIFLFPPILLITFWPWLWQDTMAKILSFLFFHKHHPGVFTYYLGKQSLIQPWHYPLVMTLVTLPPMILVLFLIGLLRVSFNPDQAKIFILFNALFPLGLIAMPSVPKYDGVRLFLPAFPFISMLAGFGSEMIFSLIKKSTPSLSPSSHKKRENGKGRAAVIIFILFFACTVYTSIFKIHPYQSSYYSEFIGGVGGAAQKVFELEYWGNAYIGVLPWMNQHGQSTFWVYMADIEPIVLWGFDLYKKDGLLKESIKFGHRHDSDFLLLLIRQGFFDEEMWNYYKYKQPVFSVKLRRTGLVNIYKLKE